MRVQNNHYHAYTLYEPIRWKHFWYLLRSAIEFKLKKGKTLTVHLPLEIQYDSFDPFHTFWAHRFLWFGEGLKQTFNIPLYWENASLLVVGRWCLTERGNTDWKRIPKNIELTLDTGHLMLGCQNPKEFRKLLNAIIHQYGDRIKHLHLHENDLVHDNHWHTTNILTHALIEKITHGRTYIWEESA